jgi:DNA-binding CsgD family transcriptional regulator
MHTLQEIHNDKQKVLPDHLALAKGGQIREETLIQICSPNTLQNQLLADFLAKGTNCRAICGTQFRAFQAKNQMETKRFLLLIDCHDIKTANIWPTIGANTNGCCGNSVIALFNVNSNISDTIEPTAIERGIGGIFYEELSLETLLKGVQAIINGELWYSRRTVGRYLRQKSARTVVQPNESAPLTSREKEILHLLIGGNTNTDIADKLNLSIHTVKTHIYNLYKKIDVPNRLQAVLWAAQHLPYI